MDDTEKKVTRTHPPSPIVRDLGGCLSTLCKTPHCKLPSEYKYVLELGRYKLLNLLQKIEVPCDDKYLSSKEEIERSTFITDMKTQFEESKIAHLRKEWRQQQKTMSVLQECLCKKYKMISLHNSYCSFQGNVLCEFLSVLMENDDLVEIFLAEASTYLRSFIKIADGYLFSFVKSYHGDIPLEDSSDYQYVLTLFTCILRISNLSSGRHFLVTREECQSLLSEVVYLLPSIKHDSEKKLVVNLLEILYNVSLERKGILFLLRCPDTLRALNDCIMKEYDGKTHKHALNILQLLSKNIPNCFYFDTLTSTIAMARLNELSAHADLNCVSNEIFKNIRMTAESFLQQRNQEQQQQQHEQGDMGQRKAAKPSRIPRRSSRPPEGVIRVRQRTPHPNKRSERIRQKTTPLSSASGEDSSSETTTNNSSENETCEEEQDTIPTAEFINDSSESGRTMTEKSSSVIAMSDKGNQSMSCYKIENNSAFCSVTSSAHVLKYNNSSRGHKFLPKPSPVLCRSLTYKNLSQDRARTSNSKSNLFRPISNTKRVSSDLKYKQHPTYKTSRKRFWSSCVWEKPTYSQLSNSKKFDDSRRNSPVTILASKKNASVGCSTSCFDAQEANLESLPGNDVMVCRFVNDNQITAWNLSDPIDHVYNQQKHPPENTVRIVKKIDRVPKDSHQTVVTKIKIPGIPFQQMLNVRAFRK